MENLTRDAVLKAIADFDDMEPDDFFRHYRIRRSRSYFIRHAGQEYDMKAVTRVACGLVSGQQANRVSVGYSAKVKRRLEEDDLKFKVVHHKKSYDRASPEGRRFWSQQRKAERDPHLPKEAMRLNRCRNGGWIKCEACGFADKERSMFDAHHLSPLVLGERKSRVSDLAVLCPTCHRWAHYKAGDRLHPLPVKQIRRGRRRATQLNRH